MKNTNILSQLKKIKINSFFLYQTCFASILLGLQAWMVFDFLKSNQIFQKEISYQLSQVTANVSKVVSDIEALNIRHLIVPDETEVLGKVSLIEKVSNLWSMFRTKSSSLLEKTSHLLVDAFHYWISTGCDIIGAGITQTQAFIADVFTTSKGYYLFGAILVLLGCYVVGTIGVAVLGFFKTTWSGLSSLRSSIFHFTSFGFWPSSNRQGAVVQEAPRGGPAREDNVSVARELLEQLCHVLIFIGAFPVHAVKGLSERGANQAEIGSKIEEIRDKVNSQTNSLEELKGNLLTANNKIENSTRGLADSITIAGNSLQQKMTEQAAFETLGLSRLSDGLVHTSGQLDSIEYKVKNLDIKLEGDRIALQNSLTSEMREGTNQIKNDIARVELDMQVKFAEVLQGENDLFTTNVALRDKVHLLENQNKEIQSSLETFVSEQKLLPQTAKILQDKVHFLSSKLKKINIKMGKLPSDFQQIHHSQEELDVGISEVKGGQEVIIKEILLLKNTAPRIHCAKEEKMTLIELLFGFFGKISKYSGMSDLKEFQERRKLAGQEIRKKKLAERESYLAKGKGKASESEPENSHLTMPGSSSGHSLSHSSETNLQRGSEQSHVTITESLNNLSVTPAPITHEGRFSNLEGSHSTAIKALKSYSKDANERILLLESEKQNAEYNAFIAASRKFREDHNLKMPPSTIPDKPTILEMKSSVVLKKNSFNYKCI